MDADTANLNRKEKRGRIVKAVHGIRKIAPDPSFELDMAAHLRDHMSREQLLAAFTQHVSGANPIDLLLRRICLRALVKSLGAGTNIQKNVSFIHPETFEIGDGVFLGEQTILQGRYDGRCVIGNGVWIGPQSYFDARDLVIEDYVGWGPGAKVLGSEHTGDPPDVPIIQTDLKIAPVRIGAWADIGVNAVILPGVTVGRSAIVGAGAIVTHDVPDFARVAGVPARIIGWNKKPNAERQRVALEPAATVNRSR